MPSCQLLSQSFESLVEAAARRLRRAAERRGDLGVGEVAAVAQRHRGALLWRQRADDLPDAVAGLGIGDPDLGYFGDWASAVARWRGDGRSPCGGRSSAASRVGCRRPSASGRRAAPPGRSPGSSPRRRCGRPRRAGRPSRRRRTRRGESGTEAGWSPMGLNAAGERNVRTRDAPPLEAVAQLGPHGSAGRGH